MNANASAGPGLAEFVALMALMTSLTAMAIDAMLPALADIGRALDAPSDNSRQLVVSAVFLGMASAQIFYGPLSDRYGRRPLIFAGLTLFIIGTLIAAFANAFTTLLIGRFIQGVGTAGPRIVTMALVRDRYSGDAMARIMSLIMAVFILVPMAAPLLGQAVLLVADWRAIFGVLLLQACAVLIWFWLRQPETLPSERRRPLSWRGVFGAIGTALRHPVALGYTLAGGLVFGAFIGFLISVQQILQEQYRLGVRFPLYFAALALVVGAASALNARLVMRYGMRALTRWALYALSVLSALFWLYAYAAGGHPPLAALMLYLIAAFAGIGVLLGNMNALAMEPLGHIAGSAAAVIGTLTTLLSLLFGSLIGFAYDGTVLPLVGGFALLSLGALATTARTERAAAAAGTR